jgi:hypothetical protein
MFRSGMPTDDAPTTTQLELALRGEWSHSAFFWNLVLVPVCSHSNPAD